jgi:hypothetical protein
MRTVVSNLPTRTKCESEGAEMATGGEPSTLSPTVLQVIDRFVAAMRADDGIQNDAIERLENLCRKGAVPKPDEINAALFEAPTDGQT